MNNSIKIRTTTLALILSIAYFVPILLGISNSNANSMFSNNSFQWNAPDPWTGEVRGTIGGEALTISPPDPWTGVTRGTLGNRNFSIDSPDPWTGQVRGRWH